MSVKLWQIFALLYFVPAVLVRADAIPLETNGKMSVAELDLNDDDIEQLTRFEEQIDHMAPVIDRGGKSFKDASLKQAAEALTDDEITQIIKSITFPNEENITEDSEGHEVPASALPAEVEPRNSAQRKGRGYYIVAFTPAEDESSARDSVPYARLQILPAERSVDDDEGKSSNSRMISKKSWNRYINRLMRQIRRGTRKVQRKTRVKTVKKEPTLESFLQSMYKLSTEQRLKGQKNKKKTSPWYVW